MKILYFCGSCFYGTVQKFKLLDYVYCYCPGYNIKGPVKFISG